MRPPLKSRSIRNEKSSLIPRFLFMKESLFRDLTGARDYVRIYKDPGSEARVPICSPMQFSFVMPLAGRASLGLQASTPYMCLSTILCMVSLPKSFAIMLTAGPSFSTSMWAKSPTRAFFRSAGHFSAAASSSANRSV